ncbi:uncharacterized protein [Dermacentor andersoni]|uniref:uncharacterized protein isoform X1 n=2 Tax=Dermacentor andersoni TaxID=34620 RepID=UPI0024170C9D|nr:uncharacterized protein LOC129382279 isoform X1 [Dermacentor andersoni]
MSSANRTVVAWAGLHFLPAVVMVMLLLVVLGSDGCWSLVLEPLQSLSPRERQETITHEERTTRGRGGGGDMMEDDDEEDRDRPSTTVVSSTRRRVVIPGHDDGDYRGQRRRGGGRNWYLVLPADALDPLAIARPLVLRQPF